VAGDAAFSGSITFRTFVFPSEDIPLVTYGGEVSDTATWTLEGQGAGIFAPVVNTTTKTLWLKRQSGTMVIFR
jgi:hypothetical protein